jgi:hypothetical protein
MSRPSAVIAVMTASALVVGCGHSWPKTTPAKADPVFAARHRPITRIDILPVDVEAWTQPGARRSADDLRTVAETELIGAASNELLARGYLIENAIGWDGHYVTPDGVTASALAPEDVLATVDSLASYGLAAGQSPGLPVPFLPARLGEVTGADATLYIGGWTFAGNDRSTGDKIAKGILIGVAIVAVVVVIAIIAKGGGDGLGNLGSGVAKGAGHAAASIGRVAARAALQMGNATLQVLGDVVELTDALARPTLEVADALGRTQTHLSIVSGPRPVWYERPEVPKKGHSRTYLELTLVDNRSGLVLWHAHQQFPTHAGSDAKAQKILRSVMASLPAAGVDPLAEFQR